MASRSLPDSGDVTYHAETSEPNRAPSPVSPSEIRALLRALGIRPQKGFGQNFLTNRSILGRIVDAGELSASDIVVEVGPGLGHLTSCLAYGAGRVVALEIDRGFVRELRRMFEHTPNVEILEQDVLSFDPVEALRNTAYKVIANLPYYLTSAALRHFLEANHRPSRIVVTVQREVGERILAKPGDLNLLAISVGVFGRPRLVGRIPANAFYPQPTVESVILRIDAYDAPLVRAATEKFFKVVSAGYAMPRKQIHNSLAQRLWMPPGAAPTILRAAGIDPVRRPQTVSIDEWDQLTLELDRRGLI